MAARDGKPGPLRRAGRAWLRLEHAFEHSLTPWIVATAIAALVTLIYVIAAWITGDATLFDMPDAPR